MQEGALGTEAFPEVQVGRESEQMCLLARFFNGLANSTRLSILLLLARRGETKVGELVIWCCGGPLSVNRCRKLKWIVPGSPGHPPTMFGERSSTELAGVVARPAPPSAPPPAWPAPVVAVD